MASEHTTPLNQRQTSLLDLELEIAKIRASETVTREGIEKIRTSVKSRRGEADRANKRARVLEGELEDIQSQVQVAREELNLATSNYIQTVQASSSFVSNEQDLLRLLAEVKIEDASLVYATSESLLDMQEADLGEMRGTAIYIASQESNMQKLYLERLAALTIAETRMKDTRSSLSQLREEEQALKGSRESLQKRKRELESSLRELDLAQASERSAARAEEEVESLTPQVFNGTQMSTQSGVLTPGQIEFSLQLSALTGLDVNVIKAWCLAEQSNTAASGREREGNHNWLNIGYFDSLSGGGAFQAYKAWADPTQAANASGAFLYGKWLGASTGIQNILKSRNKPPLEQLDAIAKSGWASSGYYGGASLRGTYKLIPLTPSPERTRARVTVGGRVIRVP
jgi:predicted  nucleic acid-binding Zn-ribbon protein